MKRIAILLFALTLVLSLCACGNKVDPDTIDKALQGTWANTVVSTGSLDYTLRTVWTFNDGYAGWAQGPDLFTGENHADSGTYVINGKYIDITLVVTQKSWRLSYTYEDGILNLFSEDGDLQFIKLS